MRAIAVVSRNNVEREPYGALPTGRRVEAITLSNAGGMRVRFLTYGGIIVSLVVPDRDGKLDDVTLGYDSLDDYVADANFMGALVGRYANRIARGRFAVAGREYQVAVNDPPNHLHGGPRGFHRAVWAAETFQNDGAVGAHLSHTCRPEDDGYPGILDVRITYTLTDENEFIVDYAATTDEATPATFTQHAYFNLAGHDRGDVLDHRLTLNASRYTPVDSTRIPTGELRPVSGTPFDFTKPQTIGARIDEDDEQLSIGGGYDHNFVIDGEPNAEPTFAARLYEPVCGRMLEIFTTEPGIQLYSGNGFDHVVGKQWRVYGRRCAVALETQHFPDSPNQPAFPSAILEPGQQLRSRTVYKFSTRTHDRHE